MVKCKCCRYPSRRLAHNSSGTQRYGCLRCDRTFSETRHCIGNVYTPFEMACRAAELLAEGNPIQSTSRLLKIKDSTVLSLLAATGASCDELMRSRLRSLAVGHLELDEICTFVRKKQKRVTPAYPETVGDAYIFIGSRGRSSSSWRGISASASLRTRA